VCLKALGRGLALPELKTHVALTWGYCFCKAGWGSIPLKVISFILQKGKVVCKGLKSLYQLVLDVSLSNVIEINVA